MTPVQLGFLPDIYGWEVIGKAISSCANNVLRKEFLHSKGWPVTD